MSIFSLVSSLILVVSFSGRITVFYVAIQSKEDVRLARYEQQQNGSFLKTQEKPVISLTGELASAPNPTTITLSPDGTRLALGTQRPLLLPPYDMSKIPPKGTTLTIVELNTFQVVFQVHHKELVLNPWFGWKDNNSLIMECWFVWQDKSSLTMPRYGPDDPPYFLVRGPKWKTLEKWTAKPEVIQRILSGEDRKRAEIINHAADFLKHSGYPEPLQGDVLRPDPQNQWEPFLRSTNGGVSADGNAIAIMENKGTGMQVILLRKTEPGGKWVKEPLLTVPAQRYVTQVTFWRDWLVVGLRDKENHPHLRFFQVDRISNTFDIDASVFIGR